ncbi:hypothetical protein QFC19_002589 [Naganishia cerealis]|uniref:Uncharacterized protein n=1 Tax=Naganishia cerealis TaxID=610337 RepID=A0ACC2WC02_9TREE|nr:hypothetical protein QFC19_002589 [Naganishia cerealis]
MAGNTEVTKAMQKQLIEVQKTDQAWGLTEGLMHHPNAIVRFFGAQNAQTKISRDWDTLPTELHPVLLQQQLRLASEAASPTSPHYTENSIVLRKLFSTLASLILRLTPKQFPDPLLTVLSMLAGHRASRTVVLEWLEIAVRDIRRGASEVARAINQEMPLVVRTITEALTGQNAGTPEEKEKEAVAALRCLEAWIDWGLSADSVLNNASDITNILPLLYSLLDTQFMVQSMSSIIEILTNSVFRDGKATKALTEPLLRWLAVRGIQIVNEAINNQDAESDDLNAISKLVEALIEHSAGWMAGKLDQADVQSFLGLLLSLTGFPGVPGRDENISEQTLMLYSTLQEELMESPDFQSDYATSPSWNIAKTFFTQAVNGLRRKMRMPSDGERLNKEDQRAFEVYRRDAGEVMVTAYYVVRGEMLQGLLDLLLDDLNKGSSWQCASEAVELGEEKVLPILFSAQVFGRLPRDPEDAVYLTAIRLIRRYSFPWLISFTFSDCPKSIGAYEEWFRYHNDSVAFVLDYIVSALDVPKLAPEAASALKAICDLCRGNLTQHVASFGALHGKVANMQAEEQIKVVEAICSVLQAIPAAEAVNPIMVPPRVNSLKPRGVSLIHDYPPSLLPLVSQAPEAARAIAMHQLQALTACANGLTPAEEDMFDLDPDATAGTARNLEEVRLDTGLQHIRNRILQCVSRVMDIWHQDTEMSIVLSTFTKAITASPSLQTLVSLPPSPLLSMIGSAAGKSYSALWPSIATSLIFRMAPSPIFRRKTVPGSREDLEDQAEQAEALRITVQTTEVLIRATATMLRDAASLQANPDVAESFFKYGSAVIAKFPAAFVTVPFEAQSMCMYMAVMGLSSTEQFTLRTAIEFLVAIMHTSRNSVSIAEAYEPLINSYGQAIVDAVITGGAVSSPRSTIPNYAEILVAVIVRMPNQSKNWIETLMAIPGYPGDKATPEAKKKFQEAVLRSRTPQRIKAALNEFALVCHQGLGQTIQPGLM